MARSWSRITVNDDSRKRKEFDKSDDGKKDQNSEKESKSKTINRRNKQLGKLQLQLRGKRGITNCKSIAKGDTFSKKPTRKRKDFSLNEELVLKCFLALEKKNGKKPTRKKVASEIGLSRQKVGAYFKTLNL